MSKLRALNKKGKAIEAIDDYKAIMYGTDTPIDDTRVMNARNNLVNILFNNGYELKEYTYKVIKSKNKRPLL